MSAEMKSARSADVEATRLTGGVAHDSGIADRHDMRVGRLVGGVTTAFGAILAAGGLWLLTLGGSSYYMLAGVGYLVAGALLWRRRATGAWLMLALLSITIAWALWEVGADYWALFPRVLLPAGLAMLALAGARRFAANDRRSTMAFAAILLTIAIAVFMGMAFQPHGVVRGAAVRPFVAAPQSQEPSDWTSYGRTNTGTRYATGYTGTSATAGGSYFPAPDLRARLRCAHRR